MQAVLVFMIAAAAQAFTPAPNLASECTLQAASIKDELGAIRPTGFFEYVYHCLLNVLCKFCKRETRSIP